MKSLEELQAIRDRMKSQINNRGMMDGGDIRIIVGMATCGIAAGARPVLAAFMEEVEARKLDNVKVSQTGCIGLCKYEPIVEVFVPGQEKITYVNVNPQKAREIMSSHIVNGRPVKEYMYNEK